jgi:diguanylate cyclase (GGDEF)-like protein/PAS domain S-box-containing protein
LKTKQVLGIAFTLCMLVSAAIAVCAVVLTRHFDALEHGRAQVQLQQGLRALDRHKAQLAQEARELAGSRHPLRSALALRADIVALLDAQGHEVRAQHLGSTARPAAALAPALRSQLLQSWSARPRDASLQQGWLSTPDGLLALCAVEVVGSDPQTLFLGRRVDAELQRSNLQVIALDDPARAAQLPREVGAWLFQAAPGALLVLDDGDTRRSVAHAVLRDASGRAVALVSTATGGDISANGRRTTWLLMGSLALVLGASSFVLIIFILRLQPSGAGSSDSSHQALRQLQESVALIDPRDGVFLDANDALLRELDYERAEMGALTLRGIYVDLPDELTSAGGNGTSECRLRARDGRLIDAEITVSAVSDAGRALLCIVGRDISQRKQAEQSLVESASLFEHLCSHDALTELPNRTYLQTHLPALLQEAADEGRLLSLMYLDLDHFKQHSDARTDGSGDALLKSIAARLRSELPSEQLLIRMDGDEFVVVAPSLAAREVEALAQRLLELVRKPLPDSGSSITASIGVAVYPQHGLDGDTLLKHADIALYLAKQGRNDYRLFADGMNLQESEHVILEQALRRAIDTDQIQLEYQPIVDLHTGLVTSFEALARWRHPQLGSVPPERFIPVADRSRLIVPLGEQIVRLAVLQLHDWQAAGLPLVPVAINVSALQLQLTELAAYVDELVRRYQVDLKWLAFEVTEAVWLQDPQSQLTTLQQLRSAGSRIYMDDCGARLPDQLRLQSLPVDAIKLDQSLIHDQLADPEGTKMVAETIALAGTLDLMTVVEGVETAEQAEQLRALGCQCGQGYYFSKPIAPLQCRSLLQHMGDARRMTQTVKIRAFRINRAAVTVQ